MCAKRYNLNEEFSQKLLLFSIEILAVLWAATTFSCTNHKMDSETNLKPRVIVTSDGELDDECSLVIVSQLALDNVELNSDHKFKQFVFWNVSDYEVKGTTHSCTLIETPPILKQVIKGKIE